MNSRDFPQRVYAIESTTATTVRSYGMGTYVGDLPRPGTEEPDTPTRSVIVKALNDEDEREEPFAIGLIQWSVEQGHMTEEQAVEARAKAYEDQKAEAARPLEERIKESWMLLRKNPCIVLDDGRTIWGMQCWWGPEHNYEKTIAGREVEIVPVPASNPRAARCKNYLEVEDRPCENGVLLFMPDDLEAPCTTCGGRCGAMVADYDWSPA